MISFSPFQKIHGGFVGIASKKFLPSHKIIFPKQVHGDEILVLESQDQLKTLEGKEADGVISTVGEVSVGVKTADCVPILFCHPEGVIAAIHAGWRGSAKKILWKALSLIKQKWNLSLEDVKIALGPSICGDCYEVGEEVAQVFQNYPNAVKPYGEKFLLDLWEVNLQQALASGLLRENIRIERECTYTSKQFYSYRRMQKQGNSTQGRNIAWVNFEG